MSNYNSYPKTDLRIMKTHKLLCDALLELLKENSFDSIHVKDICERAMVHRSTFYTHFEDKIHLLTYGLQNLSQLLKFNNENLQEAEKITNGVFEQVASFSSLYYEILVKQENHHLKTIFHNQVVQDIKEKLRQIEVNTDNTISPTVVAQFYAGAILSVISWWLENNMSIPVEQIAKQLRDLLLAKKAYFI